MWKIEPKEKRKPSESQEMKPSGKFFNFLPKGTTAKSQQIELSDKLFSKIFKIIIVILPPTVG
jgi:hypothetical protein